MLPEISIMVAIYNSEEYIEQCLSCLCNQTFKDIEIICVDDGSTDRSGVIVDEFAKKDKRIKAIHKENGGLVAARKEGLRHATGRYAAFVDGDDWMDPQYYENVYILMDRVGV